VSIEANSIGVGEILTPDLNWYAKISNEKGFPVRCPFATLESCPRYYQSISLLGQAGSTKIPPKEDERLLAYWKKNDLWPRTDEYATSISGPVGEPHQYSNFCPEIAFDRFGYFASYLGRYADEIDIGLSHKHLSENHVPASDWRWYWAALSALHYTECPIYSVLSYRAAAVTISPVQTELPWYKKYLLGLIVGIIIVIVEGLLLKHFGWQNND
jgi:hypothetical protein